MGRGESEMQLTVFIVRLTETALSLLNRIESGRLLAA